MSSVWEMIVLLDSTLKRSNELPASSRHRPDMTERLLKGTLSRNKTNKQTNLRNRFIKMYSVCTIFDLTSDL